MPSSASFCSITSLTILCLWKVISTSKASRKAFSVYKKFLNCHYISCFSLRAGQRRFHRINPEWGFSNFIAWETLIDPTNGYIVDDKCLFGAEVFVIKSKGIRECLSLSKVTDSCKREFKLSKFSELKNEWYSEEFITGDHKWYISLCRFSTTTLTFLPFSDLVIPNLLVNLGSFVCVRKEMVNKRGTVFLYSCVQLVLKNSLPI